MSHARDVYGTYVVLSLKILGLQIIRRLLTPLQHLVSLECCQCAASDIFSNFYLTMTAYVRVINDKLSVS